MLAVIAPEPDEILRRAAAVRSGRPRAVRHHQEAACYQEFAAAVLSIHSRALWAWSRFWKEKPPARGWYFRLLREAILANEWLAGEDHQFLDFRSCCYLLGADVEHVRQKILRDCDPGAIVWLIALRALELLLCDRPLAAERDMFRIPEPVIPERYRKRGRRVDRRLNHTAARTQGGNHARVPHYSSSPWITLFACPR
jgi:hypothetical protein